MRWRAPWACGPWGLFLRVGLPLARPAIAAGVALALMETVADYGTVSYFGVQTLTTGIFSTWLNGGNAGGAAQISLVILVLILVLVALERAGRRNLRFHRPRAVPARWRCSSCAAARGWLATALCLVPFACGFVLPVGVIGSIALRNPEAWVSPGLGRALVNTLVVGRGGGGADGGGGAVSGLWRCACRAGALAAAAAAADDDRLCRTRGGAGGGAADPAGRAGSPGGRSGAGG